MSQTNSHRHVLLAYGSGYILSLILTLLMYSLASDGILTGGWLITAVLILAAVQICVQLFFFLHLGREDKPRWNMLAFGFMLITLAIVVLGSLWIMHHLNYNMMHSPTTGSDIVKDEGFESKMEHNHE